MMICAIYLGLVLEDVGRCGHILVIREAMKVSYLEDTLSTFLSTCRT